MKEKKGDKIINFNSNSNKTISETILPVNAVITQIVITQGMNEVYHQLDLQRLTRSTTKKIHPNKAIIDIYLIIIL